VCFSIQTHAGLARSSNHDEALLGFRRPDRVLLESAAGVTENGGSRRQHFGDIGWRMPKDQRFDLFQSALFHERFDFENKLRLDQVLVALRMPRSLKTLRLTLSYFFCS